MITHKMNKRGRCVANLIELCFFVCILVLRGIRKCFKNNKGKELILSKKILFHGFKNLIQVKLHKKYFQLRKILLSEAYI